VNWNNSNQKRKKKKKKKKEREREGKGVRGTKERDGVLETTSGTPAIASATTRRPILHLSSEEGEKEKKKKEKKEKKKERGRVVKKRMKNEDRSIRRPPSRTYRKRHPYALHSFPVQGVEKKKRKEEKRKKGRGNGRNGVRIQYIMRDV